MAQGTDRTQWNVRLPNPVWAAADARRKALGLSRDAWTTKVLEHALTIPNPALPQPPEQEQ